MTFLGGIVFTVLDALAGHTLAHCSVERVPPFSCKRWLGMDQPLLHLACAIVTVLVLWRTKEIRAPAVQLRRTEIA